MITVNGQEKPCEAPLPFPELLVQLGLGEKPVVVEHNGLALTPVEAKNLTVTPGDTLEIIVIAAGG